MKFLDKEGVAYLWGKIKALKADKSEAVKKITRSGKTFTATRADDTTFTFTQQDTTYTAGGGLSLSGTEFSLNGQAARNVIGLGNTTGPLTLENGGTGVAVGNYADLRDVIGAASSDDAATMMNFLNRHLRAIYIENGHVYGLPWTGLVSDMLLIMLWIPVSGLMNKLLLVTFYTGDPNKTYLVREVGSDTEADYSAQGLSFAAGGDWENQFVIINNTGNPVSGFAICAHS